MSPSTVSFRSDRCVSPAQLLQWHGLGCNTPDGNNPARQRDGAASESRKITRIENTVLHVLGPHAFESCIGKEPAAASNDIKEMKLLETKEERPE
jgi:hypothetical protein